MRFAPLVLTLALLLADTALARGPLDALDASSAAASLTPEALAKLRERLAQDVGRPPDEIRASATPGLLEAQWGGLFAYVTADGRYVVYGDMVDLSTGDELTEARRRSDRLAAINQLGVENMIEYTPTPPAPSRYVVTVFTDLDCGYCRQLHREIDDYNARGIAIRYVFYPRTGPDTESFKKAVAVWCSSNHKLAFTRAAAGAPLIGNPQCANPVQREYELGLSFGIRGTPLLVLPNGAAVSGYLPPDVLLTRLNQMQAAAGSKN